MRKVSQNWKLLSLCESRAPLPWIMICALAENIELPVWESRAATAPEKNTYLQPLETRALER